MQALDFGRREKFSFYLVYDAFNFLPWTGAASVPSIYLSNRFF